MPLQKRSIAIPLGGGVQEGVNPKLLDQPALGDLKDARFNRRGEVEKRFGETTTGITGLESTHYPQQVFEHRETLVQNGSTGPHVYDPLEGRWRRTNIAGPLPCEITVDPLARGNGSYQHAEMAISQADGLIAVAYEDGAELAIRVAFYDVLTGDLLRDVRIDETSMNARPRIVFFNGRFLLLAATNPSGNIMGCWYDPDAGDYAFSSAVLVRAGTVAFEMFDVHVAGASEVAAYLVVANGNGGWALYQVSSAASVGSTYTANTGRELYQAAVLHNSTLSKVYVLYADRATSPRQLSIDVLDDDLLSAPTKTKVLDYSAIGTDTRRCTLEVANTTTGTLFCVVSHDGCDGDENGGLDYITVASDGTPGTDQGFIPNLVLCTKAIRDNLGRVVFGASREVDFDPQANGINDNDELSPAGYLLTPRTYVATDVNVDGQGNVSAAEESTVYGLAPLARFGHDRIRMTTRSPVVYDDFIGSMVRLGSVLWGSFTVESDVNLGMTETQSLNRGWKYGVDWFRASTQPLGQRVTDVEGAAVLAGGIAASFDGRRLVESVCPVVPHRIEYGGQFVGVCVGASGTDYAPTPGFTTAGDDYVTATASYVYMFRWRDAHGNLHRSATSEPKEFTFLIEDLSGGIAMENPGVGTAERVFLFPRPSFTSLSGEDGVYWQVALYRTGFTYQHWTAVAGDDNDSLNETAAEDDADTYKLVAISRIGDVTGHPNMGFIEDPATGGLGDSVSTRPGEDSPTYYTEGGELASEPCPAALDVASTQQRVFLLDAEDRLSIWYSKPLADGVAHEFNATQKIRVSAEGGEVTALAALDDKLVVFKERRIYVMAVTTGPAADGSGPQFSPPREIASDTGCSNRNSIVVGPFGVAFEAERGLYMMGRGGGLQFLGEPVQSTHGANVVRAAVLLPEDNEVRWTLSDGSTLVWSYHLNQWSISQNLGAYAATRWKGEHARLQSDGRVLYDLDNSYGGYLAQPSLEVTTAWIKLAGLQGFKRVWTAMLLGEYVSGDLAVDIAYDYDESTWTDTASFAAADLAAAGDVMQLKVKPRQQTCQAIRFRVREVATEEPRTLTSGATRTLTGGGTRTLTSSATVAGKAFVLQGLQLEVGQRRGSYKRVDSTMRG